MKITQTLKTYIKDFFQDQEQELAFYQGLLHHTQSDPKKDDNVIKELKKIIKELKDTIKEIENPHATHGMFCQS